MQNAIPATNEIDVELLVFGAIGELGEALGYEQLQRATIQTELFGGASGLDSLSLVLVVSAVEEAIYERMGATVLLASERAMSQRHSPYRTVGTLVEFIRQELASV